MVQALHDVVFAIQLELMRLSSHAAIGFYVTAVHDTDDAAVVFGAVRLEHRCCNAR